MFPEIAEGDFKIIFYHVDLNFEFIDFTLNVETGVTGVIQSMVNFVMQFLK